jgi:hypothetical protein
MQRVEGIEEGPSFLITDFVHFILGTLILNEFRNDIGCPTAWLRRLNRRIFLRPSNDRERV